MHTDDSFISIKFEDNGLVSWEKKKVSKVSLGNCNIPWNHRDMVGTAPPLKGAKTTMTKIMIEHPRPRVSLLGWRKRFATCSTSSGGGGPARQGVSATRAAMWREDSDKEDSQRMKKVASAFCSLSAPTHNL